VSIAVLQEELEDRDYLQSIGIGGGSSWGGSSSSSHWDDDWP